MRGGDHTSEGARAQAKLPCDEMVHFKNKYGIDQLGPELQLGAWPMGRWASSVRAKPADTAFAVFLP